MSLQRLVKGPDKSVLLISQILRSSDEICQQFKAHWEAVLLSCQRDIGRIDKEYWRIPTEQKTRHRKNDTLSFLTASKMELSANDGRHVLFILVMTMKTSNSWCCLMITLRRVVVWQRQTKVLKASPQNEQWCTGAVQFKMVPPDKEGDISQWECVSNREACRCLTQRWWNDNYPYVTGAVRSQGLIGKLQITTWSWHCCYGTIPSEESRWKCVWGQKKHILDGV